MSDIVQEELSALLQQTKDAHTQFEKVELGGTFDEQWADWYADFLAIGGISTLLGTKTDIDQLANQLNEISQRHKAERTAESWADYTARSLLENPPTPSK